MAKAVDEVAAEAGVDEFDQRLRAAIPVGVAGGGVVGGCVVRWSGCPVRLVARPSRRPAVAGRSPGGRVASAVR